MAKDFDIEKLRGSDNYHTWCFAIKNVLAMKELLKCIDDSEDDRETDAAKLAKCKAIMSLSVETHIYVHIQACASAFEVWQTLQRLYEDKGLTRKIALLRSLISTRLEDCDGMQQYVDQIVCASNKLTGIGFSMSDEWKGAILLAGLTDSYKPFIMGIEASNGDIKSDAIISKLIDSQPCDGAKGDALISKKKFAKYGKEDRECYNCGKKGHLRKECRGKKKKEVSTGNAKNAFSALVATSRGSRQHEWYIDSGASSHMTPHETLLTGMRPTNVSQILSANDAKLNVKGAGKTTLQLNKNDIEVSNVLHVPGLTANLLSVCGMVQKGNSVMFDRNGCTIKNARNETIAHCNAENGVYKFCANEGTCMLTTKKESALTWHRRLGHMNFQSMKRMRDGAVDGIKFSDDDDEIRKCETCAMGKQTRLPFKRSVSETSKTLEIIHSDLMGPMENISIGRARYILTFVDDFSKMVFSFFLKAKSDVLQTFSEFRVFIETQTGGKIKTFRTDNGGEYISNNFNRFFRKHGIHHELSNPHTPEQNGVAERMNRTLVERAKCLLFDADLPKIYWAEATNMATYIINRSVCASHKKTPYEMFYGKKVDLSNLRIFGSPVMVHVPKANRRKWDKKSQKLIFVGYDANTKGYRCINRVTRKLTISRDVIFHEITEGQRFKIDINDEDSVRVRDDGPGPLRDDPSPDDDVPRPLEDDPPADEQFNDAPSPSSSVVVVSSPENPIVDLNESSYDTPDEADRDDDLDYVPDETLSSIESSNVTTRRQGKIRNFQLMHFAFFVDPVTVAETRERDDAKEWKRAMEEEMKSHEFNETWMLKNLPANRKPIKSKWVFKAKLDDAGNVARYKARLVAKGCSQKYGVDYIETYSPVVRYTSIRFLMALAVQYDLGIHQMDAITAFLQGDLDEEIYMEQPEGYNDGTGRVCKLRKAVYGLKQAGRQWNIKLDAALKTFGLTKSKMDPCIYFSGDLCLLVAIYVDDFLLFYKDEEKLRAIKDFLNREFQMKDIGPAKNCIGIKIRQGKDFIELDQSNYIKEILERFGMQDSKPVKTPSDTSQKLSVQMVTEENSLVGLVPYQEAVGSLLYLTQSTRPDIAFAVNDVSRFNNGHSEAHWKAVKRIFRYLNGTTELKLRFTKAKSNEIRAYSDADWASEIDKRRSCSGYLINMSNASICWNSKRQPIVALSSTEAEYIALSSAVCEVIWLKQLADEINGDIAKNITICCDNQSTIKLAESDAFRPRTKHIDIRYHFLRDKIEQKILNIQFIPTERMAADSLTKAVTIEKHNMCRRAMGLE